MSKAQNIDETTVGVLYIKNVMGKLATTVDERGVRDDYIVPFRGQKDGYLANFREWEEVGVGYGRKMTLITLILKFVFPPNDNKLLRY